MKFVKLFSLFFVILIFRVDLKAQDTHYTLFEHSYLTTNPANTGNFFGTVRVGGILRDQWYSILTNEFVTPSLYIDVPLIRGFRKNDWVGVGVTLTSDNVGSASLKRTGFLGSAAYHMALDKNRTTVFSFGVQVGSVNRTIDINALRFEDAILSGGFSSDTNFSDASFLDINAGVKLKTKFDKQTDFNVGFAINHLGSNDYNLDNASTEELPMLATIHANLTNQMNDQWSIGGGLLYQRIAQIDEIVAQGNLGYKFDEDKDIVLKGGLGYRLGDAIEILLGVDFKDTKIAASYDFNLSGLTPASGGQGGFEIAVSHIFKIYKKPDVNPVIICPDL